MVVVLSDMRALLDDLVLDMYNLQCFDAVGWVAGRASGL